MSLNLKDICFAYSSQKSILENINLEIKQGEILGILGANGAGKTTLFKLLNARETPTSGRINLMERNLADYSPESIARKIALVPQNPEVKFSFSIEELIGMGRRPYLGLFGSPDQKDRDIIEQALTETGLREMRKRSLTNLSGGEKQLAFLARAFAQTPEILLLDEATSNLDINHSLRVLKLVKKKVEESGIAVVAIIHDINLAAVFCDKIIFLKDKGIVGPDTPRKMINKEMISAVYSVEDQAVEVHDSPLHVEYKLV